MRVRRSMYPVVVVVVAAAAAAVVVAVVVVFALTWMDFQISRTGVILRDV